MPIRVNVEVNGLAELQNKLRADVLLAPPLTAAMTAGLADVVRIVETRAPRRTGRLAGSVTSRMDRRPVPTWARVAVTANKRTRKYPRGYYYPRLIEYTAKWGHQGWFRGAIPPAKAALAQHLATAKRAIERIWAQ